MNQISLQSKAFVDALAGVVTARRNMLKLSQNELATRSGLSPTHIGYIEHSKRTPTVDSLKRIAIALDTTAGAMVCDAESACSS